MPVGPQHTFRISDVTARDFCIGCGGCSVQAGGAIPIELSRDGQYRADLGSPEVTDSQRAAASQVCPFSDESLTEDQLAAPRYAQDCSYTPVLGYHRSLWAGRVADDDYRMGSSSGGLVSFVASELLRRGDVDGVIHVRHRKGVSEQPGSADVLFEFGISHTLAELREHRKSVYYPVEFSAALLEALDTDRRYAFIGIPCHVRSLRLLQHANPELEQRIPYTIGLVCGHMKTTGFAESLGWQLGVSPEHLAAVDFRVKDRSGTANRYGTSATDDAGQTSTKKTFEMLGANWGHGFFQPKACNVCDDIFAETADIALGDAWLPRYASDPLGHNVVVVRNETMADILGTAEAEGRIVLDTLSTEDAMATQAGNVRHRRIGLEVRLADDVAEGLAVPHKRVDPTYEHADEARIALIRRRRALSELSISAFVRAKAQKSWKAFVKAVGPAVKAYDSQGANSRLARMLAPLPVPVQLQLRRVITLLRQVKGWAQKTLRRR